MAMKDSIDRQTGSKLRRMSREQCQTAEAIYELLQDEREQAVPDNDARPDVSLDDVRQHRGPARLASPFEGLSL